MATADTDDELSVAAEQGRICALAGQAQRDLRRVAREHRDLFPEQPFDAAMFGALAQATAFGAPWCDAGQLRMANRVALWIFAADWLIDSVTTSRESLDALVGACLAVVDGAAPSPDVPLARLLAEIRDELATAAAYPALGPLWRDEVRRMLAAMVREWEWKPAPGVAATPTITEYLDNGDSFGSTLVNVSHWLFLGDPDTLGRLDELITASRAVQLVLRLVNDLNTYQRDVEWNDLNALMLVEDRAEVTAMLGSLARHCRELLRPLATTCPREAAYLSRQIGFSSGFYSVGDFWGER